MKAVYRNSLRSKELIRNALISLMDYKPISDITVTDIVNTANINRGTFYNHYNNVIDVVDEMKTELLDRLMTELKRVSSANDVDSLVDLIISHIQANETEYKRLVASVPSSIIDEIKKALISNIRAFNRSLSEIDLCLIINAVSGTFIDCLKGSATFSYADLSKHLKKFILTTTKLN